MTDEIDASRMYRYVPIFPGDPQTTILSTIERNGFSITRKDATSKRDNSGNKPIELLKVQIIPLKWVKKKKEIKSEAI